MRTATGRHPEPRLRRLLGVFKAFSLTADATGMVSLSPRACCRFRPQRPSGMAADGAGDLYVTEDDYDKNERVLKLAAGATTQTVLPFTGLNKPRGVAVDTAGNLYVADDFNNRVLKLPVQ